MSPSTTAAQDQALALIVARQADPATACAYLGTEAEGVRAELDDLDVPWRESLRVGLRDGRVVAAVLVDHDEETGRSWVHGPWAADEQAWDEHAEALLDAAVAQTPEGVDDHEVCAAPAHTLLAALAADRGWHRGVVNIAYVARSDAGWPQPSSGTGATTRTTTVEDLPALAELHDHAFPGTYATARQLLDDEDRTTVVLERDGAVVGYASAEVQADGEGYLDFIAVAEAVRGQGLARTLLARIGREVLQASPRGSVNLTVREDNLPAVALYESFGFVRDAELVGYRSRPYAHRTPAGPTAAEQVPG